MTETQTTLFLQERGVKPLQNWVAHQPLLYVLEERVRQSKKGPFEELHKDKKPIPSIVRVNDPTRIDFDNPLIDEDEPQRVVYALDNPGGQLDYYVIDPLTKQIDLAKTTINRIKDGTTTPYHVRKEGLFMPSDELFPLSQNKK